MQRTPVHDRTSTPPAGGVSIFLALGKLMMRGVGTHDASTAQYVDIRADAVTLFPRLRPFAGGVSVFLALPTTHLPLIH